MLGDVAHSTRVESFKTKAVFCSHRAIYNIDPCWFCRKLLSAKGTLPFEYDFGEVRSVVALPP